VAIERWAEGIQHRQAAQFAGLPAACPCSNQPDTAGLGTGGGYAVKCVNKLGTKNQSGHDMIAYSCSLRHARGPRREHVRIVQANHRSVALYMHHPYPEPKARVRAA